MQEQHIRLHRQARHVIHTMAHMMVGRMVRKQGHHKQDMLGQNIGQDMQQGSYIVVGSICLLLMGMS